MKNDEFNQSEMMDYIISGRLVDFQVILDSLKFYIEQNNLKGILPEWKKTRTMNFTRWMTKDLLKSDEKFKAREDQIYDFDFDSWNEYFEREYATVETFLKTGEYDGLDYMPIEDFADEDGVYNVLKIYFDLYIKLFENYKRANDLDWFFTVLIDESEFLKERFYHLDGRVALKAKQKKTKSNSGKGQQEAQAKRINMLVNNLKNYISEMDHSITVNKNEFCKLVCQTFTGAELTPRHPAVIKAYHKKAEQILSMKINLTRK